MKLVYVLALTFSFFASTSVDACTFKVRFQNLPSEGMVRLSWDPPPLSTDLPIGYEIFQRRADGAAEYTMFQQELGASSEPGKPGSATIPARASETQRFEYLLIARAQNDDTVSCTGRVRGTVTANPLLVDISHRKIVPIVGSARGANGSDFRTSLTLHHFPHTKGRVYFRPVGTQPSAADPFVSYEFGDNGVPPYVIHFDDVVAAMGASGMGSLEIVPDPKTRLAVPEVEVRVYNVTANGTFGGRVPAIWAPDWFRAPEMFPRVTLMVPPVQPNFRRNVGFRTLTPVHYRVSMRTADGVNSSVAEGQAPANYTWFGSIEDLVGQPVPNDAELTVRIFAGIAIAFRTETENATNDPTVVVSDPAELAGDMYWR